MARKSKIKTLATLTDEEIVEYRNRRNLLVNKQMEMVAASNYLDVYNDRLVEKYSLPSKFDLNLQTGVISPREDSNGTGV